MAAGKASSPSSRTQAVDQLLLDLFDGQAHPLAAPVERWLTASKPFVAFAQSYQRKIHKKIKMCRDAGEARDLACELCTAYLLLQEPKFAVAYEPYTKEQGRSADYAVTFRTHTIFHVEVTRLRASQQEQQFFAQGNGQADPEGAVGSLIRYEGRRLADVVCEKSGQLSPETPNVLWVWSESRVMHALDVGQVMRDLKRGVEQRDAELYARHGFSKPADFFRTYQRLSALMVQRTQDQGEGPSFLWWQNNDARRPLPSRIATALHALASADVSWSFPAASLERSLERGPAHAPRRSGTLRQR